MNKLSQLIWNLGAPLARRWTPARKTLGALRSGIHLLHHTVAGTVPALIKPHAVNLTVAVTARCNQRCRGCLYERGFMSGEELPTEILRDLIDDAAALGVRSLRLYGGEPLLSRRLPAAIEHAIESGIRTYVTTNGVLLAERIDDLFAAGLRDLTFGLYGIGRDYDAYVDRVGNFARLEHGIAATRDRYGSDVGLRMNWLLMRPTCAVRHVDAAFDFATRYGTPIQVDLLHYSLPYFTEGPDRSLQFRPEDLPQIDAVVGRLLELKQAHPRMIENSEIGLRSIPDWLLRGPAMRVPCDKYRMVWVGADGTVQLCYVKFRLGNLRTHRLRDLLYTWEHTRASRAAFALDCPNCHCGFDERTRKHLPSRRAYAGRGVTAR